MFMDELVAADNRLSNLRKFHRVRSGEIMDIRRSEFVEDTRFSPTVDRDFESTHEQTAELKTGRVSRVSKRSGRVYREVR